MGGLPAVTSAFFDQQDWQQIRRDLYLDYRSDFARMFSETEASLFDQCFSGVASNLGSPSKYSQMVKELVAVGQELAGWKKGPNSSEVDFIYCSKSGGTIPIECKASLVTRPRDTSGLAEYATRHGSNLGILVNFDLPGTLTTRTGLKVIHIPAYLIARLPEILTHY